MFVAGGSLKSEWLSIMQGMANVVRVGNLDSIEGSKEVCVCVGEGVAGWGGSQGLWDKLESPSLPNGNNYLNDQY